MPNEDATTTTLVSRRGQIKSAVTRIQTYVTSYQSADDKNIFQLKSRLPILRSAYKDFEELQAQIELVDHSSRQLNEREEFEIKYHTIEATILEIIEHHERPAIAEVANVRPQTTITTSNVRLPVLNLPTFTGSYLDWTSFRDTFKALIHDSKLYTEIEKFHYLKSCLSGDSQKVIESFTIASDSYSPAWEALKKRYENLRIITQEHVLAIVNSPPIIKNSHTSLRKLHDDLTINLAALKSLKQPTEMWDTLLIPILTSKFDFVTKREWESTLNAAIPTINQLSDFLEKRCFLLESMNPSSQPAKVTNSNISKHNQQPRNLHNQQPRTQYDQHKSRSAYHTYNNTLQCYICKNSHPLYQCPDFLKLNVTDKTAKIKALKLCSNCFRNNHQVESCRSNSFCRHCNLKHNSLLHENSSNATSGVAQTNPTGNEFQPLLSTAEIMIKNPTSNNWIKCRALLDQGSQLNFITKSFKDKLNLNTQSSNWFISGINNTESQTKELVKIQFKSVHSSFHGQIDCLVLTEITGNLPSETFESDQVKIPSNLNLADQNFNISNTIDVLLGAEIFWKVLLSGQIKASHSNPHLQETCLGWVIGGNLSLSKPSGRYSSYLSLNNLNKQLSKFWEIEEYPVVNQSQLLSDVDLKCEEYFKETVKRDTEGRFIVRLPFKDNPCNIGNTKQTAMKRLHSLENKFKRDPNIKLRYSKFIQEYIDLNHMSLLPHSDPYHTDTNLVYLPHHGVLKESSTTTKLRVVFDGSANSTSNISLNQTLAVGPKIQNDLFNILIRFRMHQYVFTADISKMYRQILVAPEDRIYQNILWRTTTDNQYDTYQLHTVTYGLACAPYLAVKCLQKLALDSELTFPKTHQVVLKDFYIDDVLTGSDSLEDALKIKSELISLLKSGGFELHKFASNDIKLLPQCKDGEIESNHILNFDKNGNTKTLGLIWNCHEDKFRYEINVESNNSNTVTKRKILSTISKIYDPLQLLGPVIVKAKLIMQELWKIKSGWDEQVPENINKAWLELTTQLNTLNQIRIPRKVISSYPYTSIELHGFCDSSQVAYGACVFIRVVTSDTVVANLLCAKSRVAPLKTISIPRLELCAALLLARLMSNLVSVLNINRIYYWTDSTIVLAWLNSIPNNLKTFVANRVTEIQESSDINNWKHVRSADNPADVISRGVLPTTLIDCELWYHGPSWLTKTPDQWPEITTYLQKSEIPESRSTTLITCGTINPDLEILTKYSSIQKLVRIIALIYRFRANSKNKTSKSIGTLKIDELKSATVTIIKLVQTLAFSDEIRELKAQKHVSEKSKLKLLSPFLDETGIIRVGGRLSNSKLQFDQKFPIVLPKHHVTKLLIEDEHKLQLHAGPTATLAAIRQKYWPLDGRNQTRMVIQNCISCFRLKPPNMTPKMGNLPETRVSISRPFSNCGVDYGGPIFLKEGNRRSKRTVKAYICLFVCFATKSVHLELVGDLTTDSFLGALKRFIGRRGMVQNIYSDNATNFRGAQRELKQLLNSALFDNEINNYLSPINIKWHFIPARSPHFGGLWEAGIKSAKFHLKRVIGDTVLTFEEMLTLLTAVEACLNSRPLCPLSEDPADCSALTPGHFLIGGPLTAPVEPSLQHVPANRQSRWQHVEYMRQHFWTRWSKEYLSQLQARTKWHRDNATPIKIDSLVLLKDTTPPLTWKMGRVIQLHRGNDDIIRVVTVKTATGETSRSIKTICVLPVQ